MDTVKLVEVTRGILVESVHRGAVVVVDREGRIMARAGNPGLVTYIRSAAKPIQAVPVIEGGSADHFGLTAGEIALLTSSHSGEEEHVEGVKGIMNKIGLDYSYLQCGTHPPLHGASARNLVSQGKKPTEFHCVCSGKHTGMLALARHNDWSLKDYFEPQHPVQKIMLTVLAEFAGVEPDQIIMGVDGCGVPVFALSLQEMALSYARLASPQSFEDARQQACTIIGQAMMTHPHLVAGTGRLASKLMAVSSSPIIAKDGAEGIFCIGLPRQGLGIAIKIEDGHTRALGPVVINILKELRVLTDRELEQLASEERSQLKNYRGQVIGEIRPTVTLE